MLQLIFDRDDAFPLAEADPEESRQRSYDPDCIRFLLIFDHPYNNIQCIV